ncbi:MAG: hypothetical protein ABJA87_12465 [bacterium]
MSDYDHGSFYDPGALPPDPSDPHAEPSAGPPASGPGPGLSTGPPEQWYPAGSPDYGYPVAPPDYGYPVPPPDYGYPVAPPDYGGPSQPPSYHATEPFAGSAHPAPPGSAYPPPPAYVVHDVSAPTNTAGVAAFISGLLGLVLCWFPLIGLLLAVLGVALGAVGIAQGRQSGHGTGLAVAGLILGSVAFIPAFFILLAVA